MAVDPVVTYVPQTVDLSPISESVLPISACMTTYNVSNVPDDALAWMLAQGWQISSTSEDTSVTPSRFKYNMTREGMLNSVLLQYLIASYTSAYNEGRINNSNRYVNIVNNWSTQINQVILELDKMAANNNAYASQQMTNMAALVAQVDGKIVAAYNEIALQAGYLNNLGTQDVIRINEQFDNLKASTLQQLTSRGFYSSALIAQSTAQIERERSMALTDLADKLARERVAQSQQSINAQHGLIASQLEANQVRLRVAESINKGEQELYKYMIDTTDAIIIGLFGFQERRTDAYPSLEVMSQLCAQLGDSGSTSWVSP